MTWITANPFTSVLLGAVALLLLRLGLGLLLEGVEVSNAQEYGPVEEGDFTLSIFQSERRVAEVVSMGDGPESGV